MRFVSAILAVVLLAATAQSAQAASPLRRMFHGRAAAHFRTAHTPLDVREVYPQYHGGFHARSLQNIGIPTGDIGIRGNGIYPNPW